MTVLSAMLTNAFQDCDAGFPIRCHFNDNLFNLRRLQARSNVQTDVLDELLYADNKADNAKTETQMQGSMNRVSEHVTTRTLLSKRLR